MCKAPKPIGAACRAETSLVGKFLTPLYRQAVAMDWNLQNRVMDQNNKPIDDAIYGGD